MDKTFEIPDVFNQAQIMTDKHLASGKANDIAVRFGGRKITYGELVAMVNRTGNAFKDLGVEIENRVMLVLPDLPEFLYCYLGAMKIGAIPVPVNTLASSRDYRHFLNDSRAKALVISANLLEKIEAIRGELKYLRYVIVVGEAPPGSLSYHELVKNTSESLKTAETFKDDMAFWMYTSGTTGFPKGVVHLHHDILFYQPPYCEDVLGITEQDIILATSKMFFSYGRNSSLEATLMYGASVVLYPEWPNPRDILQIIEKARPTLFFSVPSFYAALLREAEKAARTYDLSSLRLCISSGEAMPIYMHKLWEARFGLQIVEGLGSTDVGGLYLSNLPGRTKPGSSGQLLRGFEGKLMNTEGDQVSPGQVGTLWLKNDGVASCYWNRHQRNKEVFNGEWFNTGDQFYQDAEGYFWYQAREDDMLKISGQWVSPLEIEGVLQEHPAVREVGVVAAPDESGLMRIQAFIVLNQGYNASSELEKELATFVHDRIAHFKTPRQVHFVQKLPRTVTGKLQRHELRHNFPNMQI